ncbi:hypothetical protein EVAR_65862_1 [Eumeta japonica]|uniref:Uncharacterized protein n=1 Tax=Eumeta variegata TaxID=151549 RepID=A0A4C1ZLN2_EUMVA|nr:hypothetical protein EVAR_65862_1 [Eumeta japonica]
MLRAAARRYTTIAVDRRPGEGVRRGRPAPPPARTIHVCAASRTPCCVMLQITRQSRTNRALGAPHREARTFFFNFKSRGSEFELYTLTQYGSKVFEDNL